MNAIAVELRRPRHPPAPAVQHRRRTSSTPSTAASPGPHVLVNALTHGNEICGAIVVDRLLREGVRPVRGSAHARLRERRGVLALRPRATPMRRASSTRISTASGRRPSSTARATAWSSTARAQLRPFVDAADYLLDIHSMLEPSPPVMICGPLDKGIRFAFDVGVPRARGERHRPLERHAHARLRRLRRPVEPEERVAGRVRPALGAQAPSEVAWQTTWRFLRRARRRRSRAQAASRSPPAPAPQKLIRVTDAVVASSPAFRFAKAFTGLEVVPRQGDVIAWDGERAGARALRQLRADHAGARTT